MKITTTQIALISLGTLSAVLLFGWVLPDFAYINRLSKDEAKALANDFKLLYEKNSLHTKDSSAPKLTEAELTRWAEIKLKLIKAGYNMNVSESNGQLGLGLEYPKYAQ